MSFIGYNESMYDIVTVGDALVDTFLVLKDESAFVRFDPIEHELCVKHGQKIPLESCSFQLGGNACNVAVGCSRLGLSTALIAEIGDDEFSKKITNTLQQEKVDLQFLHITHSQSSFAIGLQFAGERTLFIEHVLRKHAFSFENLQTKWLYITSLGNEWKAAYANALAFCKANNVDLAFNPGTLQLQDGVEQFKDVLSATNVLILNKDEAKEIIVSTSSNTNEHLLRSLQQLGPPIVVITDGEHGSFAIDAEQKIYFQPIEQCAIIGKTGAGDSFSTGFLAATILGHDMQTRLRWGTINSSAVIQHIGAQVGLLHRNELISRVAKLA